ncbi:uncharacterized protein LOC142019262 [Carettochelys insculpta]|uniref:uncharacterized protein LOC142019262 n=1 Tax=Carettochelys insculpta TaxID=44489 RepID=UPI003EB7F34B
MTLPLHHEQQPTPTMPTDKDVPGAKPYMAYTVGPATWWLCEVNTHSIKTYPLTFLPLFSVSIFEMPSPFLVPHTNLTSPDPGISQLPIYAFRVTKEKTKGKGQYKRNKINKDDISYPSNFKHLGHMGCSRQTGFAAILDSDLKKLFVQAGITEDHLKNKRTSKKIFKTIERKGGIEALREEVQMRATSSGSTSHPLLHATSCSEQMLTFSPSTELNSSSALRADNKLKTTQLAPPSTSKVLLPPWKVPAVVIAPSPPVPSLSPKKPSPVSLQGTLGLRRQQLHETKTEKTPTMNQNDLMGQIRKGIQLKSVTLSPTSPQLPNDGGIVAALRDVIQKRYQTLYSSGEETGSENEEEWED